MKIKIIDILNAIANGEQPPKKIIFRDVIYEYNEDEGDYYNHNFDALFDYHEITDILNKEVQILETTITYNQDNIENNKQDKIEKFMFTISKNGNKKIEQDIINLGIKINEIIEVINEKRSI